MKRDLDETQLYGIFSISSQWGRAQAMIGGAILGLLV